MAERIKVEVAYALPEQQTVVALTLADGAVAGDAIAESGLLTRFPDIDLRQRRIGIFGELVSADTPLRDGDLVEIYRPLQVDPKQARRLRAAAR